MGLVLSSWSILYAKIQHWCNAQKVLRQTPLTCRPWCQEKKKDQKAYKKSPGALKEVSKSHSGNSVVLSFCTFQHCLSFENPSKYKCKRYDYTVVRPTLWICGGKPCPFHILGHCPLNIKVKLPAAGNFSLKQRVSTSTLVNFTLKV